MLAANEEQERLTMRRLAWAPSPRSSRSIFPLLDRPSALGGASLVREGSPDCQPTRTSTS